MNKQAYRFFKAHAGYRVGFHAVDAAALARAEDWASKQSVEYVWDGDPDTDLGDHEYWCTAEARGEDHDHEGFQVVAQIPAQTLSSLGGIIDPDDNYRRVVEAELALEAMPA